MSSVQFSSTLDNIYFILTGGQVCEEWDSFPESTEGCGAVCGATFPVFLFLQ